MGHGTGAPHGGVQASDEEHARKRVKLEEGASITATIGSSTTNDKETDSMEKSKIAELTSEASHSREREVGILRWVNEENVGFEGVLKQRYVLRAILCVMMELKCFNFFLSVSILLIE